MSVEARLYVLREAGAERFDAGELAFVEGLVARAERAPRGARERLYARVRRYLFDLELRLEAGRAEADAALRKLERGAPDAAAAAREQLIAGDVRGAQRAAERALARLASPAWGRAKDRLERAVAIAKTRCQPPPPALEAARRLLENPDLEGDAVGRAQRLANALSLALLTEAGERSCAQLEVERLNRHLPVEVGPYNAAALAARALDEAAALSPPYLRALLGWLEGLEALRGLPPSPAETVQPGGAGKPARGAAKKRRR